MTIGVLAPQGDVAEHARVLEDSGARALLVRRVSELDQADGLIIPGGESAAMSNLLLSFGLFDILNDRIASDPPVYSMCTGMIMLTSPILDGHEDQRSLGALNMVVHCNALDRQADSYEEDLGVGGVEGGPFHVVFVRAPWVESVGEDVEAIARTGDSTDDPIVDVRRGSTMATPFHPEMGGDDRTHAMSVDMVARA